MSHMSQHEARQFAYRMVSSQIVIAGIVGILFYVFAGSQEGMSAWVGGGISATATYYQVRIAFSPKYFGDPRLMARAFYMGEVAKIAIVAALFALALNWLDLAALPLFLAFIATLFVHFFALLWAPMSGNKDG